MKWSEMRWLTPEVLDRGGPPPPRSYPRISAPVAAEILSSRS